MWSFMNVICLWICPWNQLMAPMAFGSNLKWCKECGRALFPLFIKLSLTLAFGKSLRSEDISSMGLFIFNTVSWASTDHWLIIFYWLLHHSLSVCLNLICLEPALNKSLSIPPYLSPLLSSHCRKSQFS